ncbi:MAG: efflux RND transporter periplasmic adaptor subunit [Phycisphaeraceae bacterium]|nr:efflux RND transporter periplasmic adaptor subunit [Phycisphaeraceae bacterium]
MTKRAAMLGAVGVFFATAVGCDRASPPPEGAAISQPVAPVVTAVATIGDAAVVIRAVGTVESRSRVMLKPQIAGRIGRLLSAEGTSVEAGQPLLSLDARPFESALREAEANLRRTRAMLVDARDQVTRQAEALKSMATSERALEEANALAAAAEATVLGSEAAVEVAKLNLEYCTIVAPFAGRLGQFLAKPGAVVKENETDLVELAQMAPIDVAFSVPEQHLAQIRRAAAAGEVDVVATPTGTHDTAESGRLTFIDSTVDSTTGTIRLKATFANDDGELWPGQFCDVEITVRREADSVQVPDSAVLPSQAGDSVWIVTPEQTAELRVVRVRRSYGGLSVLDSGVKSGEIVVTEGQLRLAPGIKVEVKAAAPAGAAGEAR